MVEFGQECCIRAKMVLFEKKLYSSNMVVFGQKWLYSGKVVAFGKKWLISGKVVVFVQKFFCSGKSDCVRAMLVLFVQGGCIWA